MAGRNPSTGSLPKCPQLLEPDQAKTKGQGLPLGLLEAGREPGTGAPICCLQACFPTKLHGSWGARTSTRHHGGDRRAPTVTCMPTAHFCESVLEVGRGRERKWSHSVYHLLSYIFFVLTFPGLFFFCHLSAKSESRGSLKGVIGIPLSTAISVQRLLHVKYAV